MDGSAASLLTSSSHELHHTFPVVVQPSALSAPQPLHTSSSASHSSHSSHSHFQPISVRGADDKLLPTPQILTTSAAVLKPPNAFLRTSVSSNSKKEVTEQSSSQLNVSSSSLFHVSQPIVTTTTLSSQQSNNLISAFSNLSISQGPDGESNRNEHKQGIEVNLKQTSPTNTSFPFASTLPIGSTFSFSSAESSAPLQAGGRRVKSAVRKLRPIQQQISKPKIGDTSPVASLPGASPVASLPGTSPVASLPGTSPVASLPGTSPVASLPGQDGRNFRYSDVTDDEDNCFAGQNVLSVLNEEAASRGVSFEFADWERFGPSHLPTFTVQLTFGKITAEGVGAGKKAAKEDAARRVLKQLTRRMCYLKGKSFTPNGLLQNPVGSLQEYVAKRHQPQPEYAEISKSGQDHAPVYKISCQVFGQIYIGTASNKKEAKSNAAQAALDDIVGSNKMSNQSKNIATSKGTTTTKRPVMKLTRRPVIKLTDDSQSEDEEIQGQEVSHDVLATKQSEAETVNKMVKKAYETGCVRPVDGCRALQYEDTLRELANFLGYRLTSSTFSPDHETEMVAVVMTLHLNEDTPLICQHSSSKATEKEARNDAALSILLSLTATNDPTKQQSF
ncbi:uncharacterized protein LOC134195507 isoform X2 [Corticium candelabrum]|nr:uncharacterized protein LOC134195507 isoform X2 [Corticium candelabrum]XP_062520522.1 uncharacterized protein LOC134195507 isoform X2 [Corticium candelabrum]